MKLAVLLLLTFSVSQAMGQVASGAPATAPTPPPECILGSGVYKLPVGTGDARNPMTVVGKFSTDWLSRLFEAADIVPVDYAHSSPEQLLLWGYDASKMSPEALKKVELTGWHERLRTQTAKAATRLMDDADKDGIQLRLHSGYRSYPIQCEVFNHKIGVEFKTDPTLHAEKSDDQLKVVADVNTRSAFPGQSEHQLGTSMDIVTNIDLKDSLVKGWKLEPEMDRTPAFAWLMKNAWRYGFVLSYPKGTSPDIKVPNPRTGYVYEPWHWRYIGVTQSTNYQACLARGMTTIEFLRQINANRAYSCATATASVKSSGSQVKSSRP